MILCMLCSFGMILHYLVFQEAWLKYSFIFQESAKSICFFLVFYRYCKKTADIIPEKEKWLWRLKLGLYIGITIEFIGLIVLASTNAFQDPASKICYHPTFLILRSGQELIIYLFLFISTLITRSIRQLERSTVYEINKQHINQKKALRKLWIVTGSFVFYATFQLIYDIFVFINARVTKECDLVFGVPAINEIMWFIARSIATYIWIIPILYVFWPKFVRNPLQQSNQPKKQQKKKPQIINNSEQSMLIEDKSDGTSDNDGGSMIESKESHKNYMGNFFFMTSKKRATGTSVKESRSNRISRTSNQE